MIWWVIWWGIESHSLSFTAIYYNSTQNKRPPKNGGLMRFLAEKEGFEPSRRFPDLLP